jgi:hypothetical protein
MAPMHKTMESLGPRLFMNSREHVHEIIDATTLVCPARQALVAQQGSGPSHASGLSEPGLLHFFHVGTSLASTPNSEGKSTT